MPSRAHTGVPATDAIDLRSDTVTQPTPAMRDAMARAELGDDVLEGDPTVRALEDKVATLLGKDAALFVPSGTMANLLALLSQTRPGDEIVCDAGSHVYYYEGGGYAAIAGVSVRFAASTRGVIAPADLRAVLRASDHHFPTTRLLCVENTHNRAGGVPWSLAELRATADAARDVGLRVHMDGARLWNACAATGTTPADYAACAHSISVCFSKGLGCPVGSALVGDAQTIELARRRRKMLGGSMRQCGMLAAAAIHALDHHRARLVDDHRRAARLAGALMGVPGVRVVDTPARTNMVFLDIDPALGTARDFCSRLDPSVRMLSSGPQTVRAVLHLHVDDEALERAAAAIHSAT